MTSSRAIESQLSIYKVRLLVNQALSLKLSRSHLSGSQAQALSSCIFKFSTFFRTGTTKRQFMIYITRFHNGGLASVYKDR
jgi:hypothetical protein